MEVDVLLQILLCMVVHFADSYDPERIVPADDLHGGLAAGLPIHPFRNFRIGGAGCDKVLELL
jgi:hypothetical protein